MSTSQIATPLDGTAMDALARAHGPTRSAGKIRSAAEDFVVDELLGFEPTGTGEHALLQIRKRNTNTEWLARQLARHAGVRPSDVGFAGLKDRRAVTSQWFSVHLPGKPDPDWSALEGPDLQLLACSRHDRKLRRGALSGNRFDIRVRDLEGDTEELQRRLRAIAGEGVPNYFGEQRFGREGGNLREADALFRGQRRKVDRHKRGLYLSAARSFLFNLVLAHRVEQGSWSQAIAGDVMMLAGTQSIFPLEEVTEEIRERVARMDIHPTGPMWGRGRTPATGACLELETEVLAPYEAWRDGLEHAGLSQERRALRMSIQDLDWSLEEGDCLRLQFSLGPGSYATTFLREVLDCSTAPDEAESG